MSFNYFEEILAVVHVEGVAIHIGGEVVEGAEGEEPDEAVVLQEAVSSQLFALCSLGFPFLL